LGRGRSERPELTAGPMQAATGVSGTRQRKGPRPLRCQRCRNPVARRASGRPPRRCHLCGSRPRDSAQLLIPRSAGGALPVSGEEPRPRCGRFRRNPAGARVIVRHALPPSGATRSRRGVSYGAREAGSKRRLFLRRPPASAPARLATSEAAPLPANPKPAASRGRSALAAPGGQRRLARRTTSAMCGVPGGGSIRGSTACSSTVKSSPSNRKRSSAPT